MGAIHSRARLTTRAAAAINPGKTATVSATQQEFQWVVIGAGPAGIAAIGKLLDAGISEKQIAWIDPHFDVGLLGRKWRSVSSNTTVQLFVDFLTASPAFKYNVSSSDSNSKHVLHSLSPTDTCKLSFIADPLLDVTAALCAQVVPLTSYVVRITKTNKATTDNSNNINNSREWQWQILTESTSTTPTTLMPVINASAVFAENIVLATGSVAKTLHPPKANPALSLIPLEDALQIDRLTQICVPSDSVAVFGSSHSAIMIIRDLLETVCVHEVINIYRADLSFAENVGHGKFINDSTGLKGNTATWARENLLDDRRLPQGLMRIKTSGDKGGEDAATDVLKRCTKVIYAIGFERERLDVEGVDLSQYDAKTGVIVPGLFGVGIAFPELGEDAAGNLELQVGLWKFMKYLNRIVPEWVENSRK
ncbi:hypothetical protein HK100_007611 [Physocladia obscura]|uniref:FAD/NAD(P)-binding domain-containing protein n=1 Tax=Physocladia obscura TaxID=109957 RepID=A0AAD5XKL2_9FUNG|nr:hypothetical protein HK100_007611 [Physocladia obscura]